MQWIDNAIILSTRKHGESAGIVSLMTYQHGLFNGLVRGISSKKNCGIYQTGNLVQANWRGRLSEHLGNFTCELQNPNAALLMGCPQRLAGLNSICSILESTLAEREPAPQIYQHLFNFIQYLNNDKHWQLYYVLLEIELLSHLGFRLDLQACAATGQSDNLIYISPKSGRAVSAAAGEPYKNKLLKMPKFFVGDATLEADNDDITNGLKVSSYFLEKYIFAPHNKNIPQARLRFADLLQNTL